jgi:hypothetical protein
MDRRELSHTIRRIRIKMGLKTKKNVNELKAQIRSERGK